MANLPLAFAELLGGGLLAVAGISGSSIADTIRGHVEMHPFVAGGGATSQTPVTAAGGGTLPSGGQTHGLVSMAALAAIGASHGWSGQQITDWMNVVKQESNGTLTDTNPSSGAYGIAQFIQGPSQYAQYGGNSTTLTGQLTAMANYIAQRYGNPSAAWAHEQASNWY
jgi:hypothetical protein